MIYAITGRPGKGKSYYMVRLAKQLLESGIDVYSLIDIDETKLQLKPKNKQKKLGNLFTFNGLKDFKYIFDGVVLLDEAGSFFEAREWAKFSPDDRVKFQQHRKQELDIYLGVQSFNRLDSSIRELTAEIIDSECFPSSSRRVRRTPWFFWYRTFDPEFYGLKKQHTKSVEFLRFNKQLASAYDSKQFVNLHAEPASKFTLMKDKIASLRKGVIT